LLGSFLGALLIIGSPWAVSKLGLQMEPELIAGVVLVVFTLVARDGVVGLVRPWFRERLQIVEPEAARSGTKRASGVVTTPRGDNP
jgi:hypothetical protein